ncbi:intestine-specific homeobox-like [Thalassophryne amazonica]|uniref:intestine-specific homeobox-like n=1 Tax=Thalassophryne amazonica TaxID=390379 RepID=UPI0014721173|nr:intestine-specific homeobox-like [Thalassophryne amazonica]
MDNQRKHLSHSIEEILRKPTCIRKQVQRVCTVIQENTRVLNQDSWAETSQSSSPEESSNTTTDAKSAHLRKKRQTRITFTPFQVNKLEKVFQRMQYPNIETRDQLVSSLHLTKGRIQIWFQNRRAKWRKAETLKDLERMTSKYVQSANHHHLYYEDEVMSPLSTLNCQRCEPYHEAAAAGSVLAAVPLTLPLHSHDDHCADRNTFSKPQDSGF